MTDMRKSTVQLESNELCNDRRDENTENQYIVLWK
mgnify:CR=1 FL=1